MRALLAPRMCFASVAEEAQMKRFLRTSFPILKCLQQKKLLHITLTTCRGVTVAYSSSNVEWMKAMSSMVVLVVSVSWR